MKKLTDTSKPRVYSYIRFSTPEQAKGRSEDRQTELAEAYAKKHGLQFDPGLRMADRGASGYKGDNLKFGALGAFVAEIDAGKINQGSVLVVENIDRISRLDFFDAFDIISRIIRKGVAIHTTSPEATYDRSSATDGRIYALVGQIVLAHAESSKKAERLGDAWAAKKRLAREGKTVATKRCPAWLEKVGKGETAKLGQIENAVKTVQMIFDLAPKLGRSRLVKLLNEKAPWTPPGRKKDSEGSGWRKSYITKILSNRAVLGEYQPFTKRGGSKRVPDGEPIANYYPAIIEPSVFYAVQQHIEKNRGKGGRTGAAFNVFQNLVKCAYCGGPMHFRDRGPLPKGGQYLVCDNAERGLKCEPRSVRYAEIQETVLNNLISLRPEQVLPDENENSRQCEVLRTRIAGAEGELDELKKLTANADQLIFAETNVARQARWQAQLDDLEKREKLLSEQLKADRARLQQESQNRQTLTAWKQNLDSLKAAIAPRGAVDARLRLQSHLREFISKIDVFATGVVEREEPGAIGLRRPPALPANASNEERRTQHRKFAEFCRSIVDRRMTREGRFYRIHFKTGRAIDIVPSGSIATGLAGDGNELAELNVLLLWKEFLKKDRANTVPVRSRNTKKGNCA